MPQGVGFQFLGLFVAVSGGDKLVQHLNDAAILAVREVLMGAAQVGLREPDSRFSFHIFLLPDTRS